MGQRSKTVGQWHSAATLSFAAEPRHDELLFQVAEELAEPRPLRLVEEESIAGLEEVARLDVVIAGGVVDRCLDRFSICAVGDNSGQCVEGVSRCVVELDS